MNYFQAELGGSIRHCANTCNLQSTAKVPDQFSRTGVIVVVTYARTMLLTLLRASRGRIQASKHT